MFFSVQLSLSRLECKLSVDERGGRLGHQIRLLSEFHSRCRCRRSSALLLSSADAGLISAGTQEPVVTIIDGENSLAAETHFTLGLV